LPLPDIVVTTNGGAVRLAFSVVDVEQLIQSWFGVASSGIRRQWSVQGLARQAMAVL
jgi:hypothetical protein